MKYISLFDIIGPIMVGPSSSHTAGAIRLGLLAKSIYGDNYNKIKFTLYNSFAKTGKGHGTDKGLIGGVLGFNVDDVRIKDAFYYAEKSNLIYEFEMLENPNKHPNSVDINFYGDENMTISGNSLGAGEVEIVSINGYKVNLKGNMPTLLLIYKDQPGIISSVTKLLQDAKINIASLNCERTGKGEEASMSICLDSLIPNNILSKLYQISDMYTVRNIEVIK